jgi:hypothetical protein
MSFTFAPLVGVEYFRAFFGQERCVLCFCALKKITSGHPLKADAYNALFFIANYRFFLSVFFLGPYSERSFI